MLITSIDYYDFSSEPNLKMTIVFVTKLHLILPTAPFIFYFVQ